MLDHVGAMLLVLATSLLCVHGFAGFTSTRVPRQWQSAAAAVTAPRRSEWQSARHGGIMSLSAAAAGKEGADSKGNRVGVMSLSAAAAGKEGADSKGNRIVTLQVPLGRGWQPVEASFRPLFSQSELFMITYKVPFSLNVDRAPKNFPCPIVTKDGPGGEKEGDVLRATTSFSQGFNAAGVTSDIAQFAGNIKWRQGIFDTTGAQWEQVVAALLSNTEERIDSVTLVFEREKGEREGESSS